MNCKVCGAQLNEGAEFCSVCGANVASFENVQPNKIIYNQSPSVQNYEGDDSVTELIPENYGQVEGDDSVTELIPENYGQVEGDDSVTQLIPNNKQYQPQQSQQPQYAPNMQGVTSGMEEEKKGISGVTIAGIVAGVVTMVVVALLIILL